MNEPDEVWIERLGRYIAYVLIEVYQRRERNESPKTEAEVDRRVSEGLAKLREQYGM